ncbi:DUF2779 domain-containing protein [Allobaculum sp. Allo2]|nr:DUF2779 domain-containing protein [Allobaculum sp. Allo2]
MLCFQYSLHVETREGKLSHTAFLKRETAGKRLFDRCCAICQRREAFLSSIWKARKSCVCVSWPSSFQSIENSWNRSASG